MKNDGQVDLYIYTRCFRIGANFPFRSVRLLQREIANLITKNL